MRGTPTSPNTTTPALIGPVWRIRHEPRHNYTNTALEPAGPGSTPRLFASGRGPSASYLLIAGQTALDRGGALVGKGDFAAQADQVFRDLAVALEAVGCTAANLVKLTVFLRDMDNLRA
jgi:enamine deaminase RidA (YjgF/YER057c/UK114 family)